MAFRGFPPEAIAFYEGLEADNSRSYWQAHRQTYDEAVRGPMHEMLEELAPEFGEFRIFRPKPRRALQRRQEPVQDGDRLRVGGRGRLHLLRAALLERAA